MRGVLLPLACLLTVGCATFRPVVDETDPVVHVTEEVRQFMALIHPRMTQHSRLPDIEILTCLSGHVVGSRVYVTGIVPRKLYNMTPIGLDYSPCPREAFGSWHTHPTIDGLNTCQHSLADIASFERQPYEIVSIVTCTEGNGVRIVPIVKRGYSRWRQS